MSFSVIRSRAGNCSGITRRELLRLVPLLLLYVTVVHFAARPTLWTDEVGYVANAGRLAGHPMPIQEPSLVSGKLWWGPGYPLLLAPFVVFKIPWIVAKYLNAGFLFGATVYFYALMKRYLPENIALVTTIALGIQPPWMRQIHLLFTEPFVFLLICGFMFHFCALYNDDRRRGVNLAVASLFMAYLALTKVFFGYVIAAVLLLSLGILLWRRTPSLQKATLVFSLALLSCVPYLMYTYSQTGRVFYWGSSGGLSLYWMSAPYPGELGSWIDQSIVNTTPKLTPQRAFLDRLDGMPEVERDIALKQVAISNIRRYPEKYAENWVANVGRLLWSYPFSLTPQKLSTYFYMLPNMFIVVLFVLSLIPAVLRPKAIPFEMWALLVFAVIAFAGSTLLSADSRQFEPLAPPLWAWIGFVYVRVLHIDLRGGPESLSSREGITHPSLAQDEACHHAIA